MKAPRFKPTGLLIALASCFFSQAIALVTDSEQPIEIESDSAEFRETEGLTVYQGNVRLTQGSIVLESDRISLRTMDGQITELVAEGEPATYRQAINTAGEEVVAESRIMEYRITEGVLTLTQGARLTQQGTTLSGSQIVYDVTRHVLQASSQGESQEDRVRVTIPPANLQESSEDSQ